MLVASQTAFPEQSPPRTEFLADMKKYAPYAPLSFFSIQAWSSVKLFAAVASEAKATTNSRGPGRLQEAVHPGGDQDDRALQDRGRESPVTDGFVPAPRMFNQEVQLGTMQDKKFEPSGGFVNPFDGLDELN